MFGAMVPAAMRMAMAGGSGMSPTWMRAPGASWLGAAASFLAMWMVMMAAMMLPSVAPMLWRYGRAVSEAGKVRLAGLTALAAAAYLLVWAVFGAAAFPLGAALALCEARFPQVARAVPLATGIVVLVAGALQFTTWKAHHLACWRAASARERKLPADAATAWRYGVRLGVHCGYSSAGPTAVLLVTGMMDPRAMALVTAVITVERLAPSSARMAALFGGAAVVAGVVLIARTAGLS